MKPSQYFSSTFVSNVLPPSTRPPPLGDAAILSTHVNEEKVVKIFRSADLKTGYGPDKIHPVVIRKCVHTLAIPLTIIYNKSL